VRDDNRISQLGGGGTLGCTILPPLGVQISYGTILTSNGGEGVMTRARITMMF